MGFELLNFVGASMLLFVAASILHCVSSIIHFLAEMKPFQNQGNTAPHVVTGHAWTRQKSRHVQMRFGFSTSSCWNLHPGIESYSQRLPKWWRFTSRSGKNITTVSNRGGGCFVRFQNARQPGLFPSELQNYDHVGAFKALESMKISSKHLQIHQNDHFGAFQLMKPSSRQNWLVLWN